MAERSLFKIVNESQNSEDNEGKRLVGYTVSSYKGVLSALEKAKQYQKQDGTSSAAPVTGQVVREVNYSILGETGLDQDEEVNGFIKNQYQGLCTYKDFMSFVIDYKSSDGKMFTKYVSVDKNDAQNKHLSRGIGCIGGGKPIFPMTVKKEASYYSGLDSDTSTFKIGVGIDISNFGVKFFKFFFPNIEWDESKLKTLAAKECLFAEVLMPLNATSNTAKVLHAMVIADVKDYQGCPFQVHIPNPLLLLSDYSKIGSVIVNCSENSGSKEVAVGDGNVTNPLASKTYYHKDASIDGFTPQYVETFARNENGGGVVSYTRTTLQSGNLQTKGRVRLFFSPESKGQVSSVVGDIPSEYEKELFQGKLSENQIVKTKVIIESAANIPTSIREVLEQFNAKLKTPIPVDGLYKALLIVAYFESNGQWTKWRDIGDNQGVSAGALQCTENSGGIAHVIETFIGIKKAEGGDCTAEEELLKRARNKNLTDKDAATWKQMYNENPMRMQVAQMKAWAEGEHGEAAIEICNAFSPTSPLAFAAIAGASNHWPSIMLSHYRNNGMTASMSEKDKVIYAEAIHLKVSIKRQSGKVVPVKDIIANPLAYSSPTYVGDWRGWCNRCKAIIDGANGGDMDIANYKAYYI